MAARPAKLRLLCLHGFQQTGSGFRSKLGGLRKAVRGVAELEFMDAPHVVAVGETVRTETGLEFETQEEGRAWWRRGVEQEEWQQGQEVEESMVAIGRAWREGGQYDGLLCFSQGAALGGILCLLQHQGKLGFEFNFIILVSGFTSDKLKPSFEEQEGLISIPSLHVMGESDRNIVVARSLELASKFCQPTVCPHPGGHHLPYKGEMKERLLAFLGQRLGEKVEKEEASLK